jgi:CRP-like cAMP-binding protein
MKNKLKNYFDRYVDLSEEDIESIFLRLEVINLKKKDFLLHEGKICKNKYFILDGLVRLFELSVNGNETITQFGIENWWITNLDSFINETPSRTSIQALEKTVVLSINKKNLEDLFLSIPKLERAFRMITENMLIAHQRKDEVYMKKTSKERYYSLVKTIPNFAQRVPQYMIASYLNITPEYLSEIRKYSHKVIS